MTDLRDAYRARRRRAARRPARRRVRADHDDARQGARRHRPTSSCSCPTTCACRPTAHAGAGDIDLLGRVNDGVDVDARAGRPESGSRAPVLDVDAARRARRDPRSSARRGHAQRRVDAAAVTRAGSAVSIVAGVAVDGARRPAPARPGRRDRPALRLRRAGRPRDGRRRAARPPGLRARSAADADAGRRRAAAPEPPATSLGGVLRRRSPPSRSRRRPSPARCAARRSSRSAPARRRRLRRLAQRYALDCGCASLVVAARAVGAVYVVAGWPARRGRARRSLARRRPAWGIGCLVLAALLLLRAWGLWVGDALVWPVALVAAGAALIWRQSQGAVEALSRTAPRAGASGASSRAGPARGAPRSARRWCSAAGSSSCGSTTRSRPARDVMLASSWWSWPPALDPRAVVAAARARPRRRARGAHPLAGARRGRRAPARLRPADARADAEARRRPARGRDARPPPGARAARLAQRRRRGRDGHARRRAAAPPRPTSRRRTAPRSRSSPSATAPLDADTRGARRRRARGAHQRGEVRARRRRSPCSPRWTPTRVEVFVRDRGPGFDAGAVPGRPPRRARVRSSGAWSATAAARRSTRRPARAPRSSSSADERL